MAEKIKSNLRVFPAFGLALWLGYQVTLQMTGSVDKAIERMVVAVVLWVICALLWGALCALRESLNGPSSFDR